MEHHLDSDVMGFGARVGEDVVLAWGTVAVAGWQESPLHSNVCRGCWQTHHGT